MTLFNGLHIMQRKDLCDEYMGRFPVVFLTLKGVDGLTFEKATNKLIKIVALVVPPLWTEGSHPC